jgi:hypothetical protein
VAHPGDWAARRRAFAAQLDDLRQAAGFVSARRLAQQTFATHATVAAALRGLTLPTAAVVQDIVQACGGTEADRVRWEAERSEIAAIPAITEARHSRQEAEIMDGRWTSQDVIDGADPDDTGCSADAVTIHARRIYRTCERRILGYIQLRYSPSRGAVWARFGGFPQLDAIARSRGDVWIDVSVHRGSDQARGLFSQLYAYDVHWCDLLVADHGAFWAAAVIRFGDERAGSGATNKVVVR